MTLYIFTPTYNRSGYLSRLYMSLCRQTNQDFIWLVVDDGSTDKTGKLIQSFIEEDRIAIQYYYKENGGKHTAYNLALELMNGKGYHICVDSDDYLFDNAIEEFHRGVASLGTYLKKRKYIGAVYPKTFLDRKSDWLPLQVDFVYIPDFQFVYRLSIETTILIDNRYTRFFRFAVFQKETFLSEETLYYYLADFGGFYPIKKEVYCAEYLPAGLTSNLFTLWQKNYQGTLYSLDERNEYIAMHLSGIAKWRSLIACQLNRQALKLTRQSIFNLLREEKYRLLLPLSYLWKQIRFKG